MTPPVHNGTYALRDLRAIMPDKRTGLVHNVVVSLVGGLLV